MAVSTRYPYERGRSTVYHSRRDGVDIKRIDFGISGSTALLPAYLPSYELLWNEPSEICYHIAPPACGIIYLTVALSNEDDGVDLINGHYCTSNFRLALKQWQIKDLQPCHTAVCSIINELMQGKLVNTEELPLEVEKARKVCSGLCLDGKVGTAKTCPSTIVEHSTHGV